MDWRFTPYAVPLFTGAVILLGLSLVAWRRRAAAGAGILAALTLASFVYVLGYALELSSASLSGVQFWIKVEYIGIVAAPALVFSLMLAFTGKERYLTPLTILILVWIPATTLILAWTNGQHHLIWRDMHLVTVSGSTFVEFTAGPWYWVNVVYIVTLTVGTAPVLLTVVLHQRGIPRRQAGVFLAGLAVPVAAYPIYLSGIVPVPLDLTPYGLVGTGLILGWAVLNYQFLDILPVARQVVLDSMADAVVVTDARGRVRHLNPAARSLIGVGERASLGSDLADLFAGQLTPSPRQGSDDPGSEIAFDVGGATHFFDTRVSFLNSRPGRPEGTLIVLRDITERKQAEEDRERLIAGLDAFAHTVAHDLKNLVTVLVTYAVSLQEDFPDMAADDIRIFLDVIAQTGQKMDSVIDALLLLARVDKAEHVPVEALDMAAIVAQVLQRLAVDVSRTGAHIIVPEVWPTARGYAPWVEEIWVNYITNAIKYGGSPLRITLGATPQPDGAIRFWVQDNGSGLTCDQQAQLFTPFRRLHQLRADGHGLGLSIVRDITEKLGGQANVESLPGQGSVFSFTLPACPAAIIQHASAPAQIESPDSLTRGRNFSP